MNPKTRRPKRPRAHGTTVRDGRRGRRRGDGDERAPSRDASPLIWSPPRGRPVSMPPRQSTANALAYQARLVLAFTFARRRPWSPGRAELRAHEPISPKALGPTVFHDHGPMSLKVYRPTVVRVYRSTGSQAYGAVGLWACRPMVLWAQRPVGLRYRATRPLGPADPRAHGPADSKPMGPRARSRFRGVANALARIFRPCKSAFGPTGPRAINHGG